MSTLRGFLDSAKFDWSTGRIVVMSPAGRKKEYGSNFPGRYISFTDPVLDEEFDSGFGGDECPEYMADDKDRIYFHLEYDGYTRPSFVYKDVSKYVGEKHGVE